MKENLKNIEALLLIGTLALIFMPLIDLKLVEISTLDILKLTFDEGQASDEIGMYGLGIMIIILIICLGAVFTAMSKGREAHTGAILSSVIDNVLVFGICLAFKGKVNELGIDIPFIDIGDYVNFSSSTIMLWLLMHIAVIGLACYALNSEKAEAEAKARESVREPLFLNEMPQHREPQRTETVPSGRSQQTFDNLKFYGAVAGESGMFQNMAYPLQERQELFFQWTEGQITTELYKSQESLAGIYFIPEYQEYCVEVFARVSVFLESGQPLGKDRRYYLPRGTEIYMKDDQGMFKLA
jgi:hypothetical protein|nr:hypothetical protein [uncultured Faecalimonas sp.]